MWVLVTSRSQYGEESIFTYPSAEAALAAAYQRCMHCEWWAIEPVLTGGNGLP